MRYPADDGVEDAEVEVDGGGLAIPAACIALDCSVDGRLDVEANGVEKWGAAAAWERGEDSGVEGQDSQGSVESMLPEASSSDEEESVQVSLIRERGGVAHLVDAGDGLSDGIGSAGSVETRRRHRDDAFWK